MSGFIGGTSAGKDLFARAQIALTNLRLLLTTSVATGALASGYQWELGSDEWGASSTNETYAGSGPAYYHNPEVIGGPTSYANSGGTGNRTASITVSASGFSFTGGASSIVNGNTSESAGAYVGASVALSGKYIQFDFGAGASKVIQEVKIYLSAGTYSLNGSWQWQGSLDGTNWINIGGGYADTASTPQMISTMAACTDGYRYFRLLGVGGTTGANTPYWSEFEFKIVDAAPPPDMTLISPASISVAIQPLFMDAFFLWKDETGGSVVGTDVLVDLSRDGGTTWTAATLSVVAAYDGTYSCLQARADVSGRPAGTSMKMRIKTLHGKAQRIAAPALYAE